MSRSKVHVDNLSSRQRSLITLANFTYLKLKMTSAYSKVMLEVWEVFTFKIVFLSGLSVDQCNALPIGSRPQLGHLSCLVLSCLVLSCLVLATCSWVNCFADKLN